MKNTTTIILLVVFNTLINPTNINKYKSGQIKVKTYFGGVQGDFFNVSYQSISIYHITYFVDCQIGSHKRQFSKVCMYV